MVCRESGRLLARRDGGDASVVTAVRAGLGLVHVIHRVFLPAA